ncbi:hypothetical protein [Acinetobacter sp. CFCC 11171]|uniref:hypothetical protein n=1 Tax=Acinetobacter sp. CFCC 11171 TaxID=1775558 RepID=UPI000DCFB9E9|nr:hypothetical protein [Acinetobacter sp. CFCC 11171]
MSEILINELKEKIEKNRILLINSRDNNNTEFLEEFKEKSELFISNFLDNMTVEDAISNWEEVAKIVLKPYFELYKEYKNNQLDQGMCISANYLLFLNIFLLIRTALDLRAGNKTDKFILNMIRAISFSDTTTAQYIKKIDDINEKSERMRELAHKKHEGKKEKDNKTKDRIKQIWLSSNWDSYTQCANHIHKNALVDEENYRKIYSLLSKAAKEKR